MLLICYSVNLYICSFLTPWFPLLSDRPDWMVGLHLLISLCFFDSLLTFGNVFLDMFLSIFNFYFSFDVLQQGFRLVLRI